MRWTARQVAQLLSQQFDTDVQVGRIQLGLFNRVVIDDLLIHDQQGDTLLAAARLSAKLDPWQLMQGRCHIGNAQLFGFDIRLRRPAPELPYNFQFIIDQLSNEDSTSAPLDLSIESVIIRRGCLSHEIKGEKAEGSDGGIPDFTLEDLALRLSFKASEERGIKLDLNDLRFHESRSGLSVEKLKTSAFLTSTNADSIRVFLSDLSLQLPASEIHVPRLEVNYPFSVFRMMADGHLTPADLTPLLPVLDCAPAAVDFSAHVFYDDQKWRLPRFSVKSEELLLQATGNLHDTDFDTKLMHCHIGTPWFQAILKTLQDAGTLTPEMTEKLLPLSKVDLQGNVSYQTEESSAALTMSTLLGSAELQATLLKKNDFTAILKATLNETGSIIGDQPFLPGTHSLSVHAEADGSIREKHVHAQIQASDHTAQGDRVSHLSSEFRLSPRFLRTTTQLSHPQYSGQIEADIQSTQDLAINTAALEHLSGQLQVHNLKVRHKGHALDMEELSASVDNDDEGHHVHLLGDCIDAQANGHFHYTTLVSTCQQLLHGVLPALIPQPAKAASLAENQIDFKLRLWEADSLLNMAGINLQLPQTVVLEGELDGEHKHLNLNLDAPHILFGNEDLRSLSLIARQQGDYLRTFVTCQRWMEDAPIHITLTSEAEQNQLETFITWEANEQPAMRGRLSAKTLFQLDEHQHLKTDIHLHPSQIIIADTTWHVHEANLRYQGQRLDVSGFKIAKQGRYLQVDGAISGQPTDTLSADLRGIDLEYVFGLLDFHDVELAGVATGKITASNLMTQPFVSASLDIQNFHFENTLLGRLNVTGGWGRATPKSIDLDGWITEPQHQLQTHVQGTITPGHGPTSGLDLDVQANNLNTGFVTEYARGIFQDFIGRASGHAHIHGPFKQLDLDGAVAMDTLAITISSLGTRYHSVGRDSVWLNPGGIRVKGFQMFDQLLGADSRAHRAVVDGELRWQHFKHIRYAFDITATDLLGYDFRDFGDEVFYATILASGTCRLTGDADHLNVELQGSPSPGSTLTYNASTPETLTNNQFITFVEKDALPNQEGGGTYDPDGSPLTNHSAPSQTGKAEAESEDDDRLDIHISFDIQVTPDAQVRLLMDSRSEDYITLYGNGGIRATYHNKGRFQMYGTYHVERGTYRLTLQDVIRKDFQFQQGGTIVFGGTPMKAGLNLQAIYTVPSVSLNDLAAGSNFSASNVRVNCLMNIGGLAEQPQVTFDFDIPNVNEDEKRMVRALISTDEERNLQVIYLLGIGRFYTYGLSEDQSQTNTAMQSLLSSTLSGQLNDILANTIGNQKWNFGTSLSTGTQGWSDMDVEGMLSGRLLNNRLLINGTFGYRDTPVANTNFIGDFDIQWLITPSGALSLKAYSQTNDRYFTKTALTTQGIGIRLHKDFSNLRELFKRRKTD